MFEYYLDGLRLKRVKYRSLIVKIKCLYRNSFVNWFLFRSDCIWNFNPYRNAIITDVM
jgi:hypothetical protein